VAKRGSSGKGKSELHIYNSFSVERLQMDILDLFPVFPSGNKYLLVISDCFIKWMEAFPMKNFRIKIIVEIFVNQVISRFDVKKGTLILNFSWSCHFC